MSCLAVTRPAPLGLPATRLEPRGWSWWLVVSAGMLWGGLAACSHVFEERAAQVQGLALAGGLSLIVWGLLRRTDAAWLRTPALGLLAAHVTVATTSGLLSDSEMSDLLRYAALLPAMAAMLAVANSGPGLASALRWGLTWSGVGFTAFHAGLVDWGSWLDPRYRLSVFLNPNSTGFIAAITAVSALDLSWMRRRTWPRLGWIGVVALSVLVCFATKSRTALATGMVGGLVVAWLRVSRLLARGALLAGMGALVLLALRTVPADAVVETLSLDERDRSIVSGTGRYQVWHWVLTELWPRNPWLGVGPGRHDEEVLAATQVSSAHNGLLMALAETGVLGTVPLVLILGLCLRQIWRQRGQPDLAPAAGLFAAGLVESLGEVMLFSMGNPGSLLFLWAVAWLSRGSGPAGRPSGAPGAPGFQQ